MTHTRMSRGRRLVAVLTALTLAAATFACGNDDGSDESSGGTTTLTFWSWVPNIQNVVDLWNSGHPDVQVKLEAIPSGGDGGYGKMFSALKAGNAPDLAQVEYQEIPNFLLTKGLEDITDEVSGAKDKFVEWQWQQGVFDGRVYAVPQASGPMGLFYRQDLFDRWGIAPPATWAEFAQAAQKVRQADPNAYISTFPPGNSAWFTALAWQAGAKWFGTEGDAWTVDIDNEPTQKVAAYWQDLVSRKLVKTVPDFANEWYKDLQDGRIVAWVSAQWGDAILRGNAPATAGRWRVAPMPQWTAGGKAASNWGGSSTAVLAGSDHVDEAAEFAVWLNSDPAAIDLLIKDGYGWPAAVAGSDAPALSAGQEFFGGQKINEVFAEADRNVDKDWQWIPTTAATYQHLNDGFSRAVAGQGTFGAAVTAAQAQTVADLKAKGLDVVEGG